jgi:hypothetical protein
LSSGSVEVDHFWYEILLYCVYIYCVIRCLPFLVAAIGRSPPEEAKAVAYLLFVGGVVAALAVGQWGLDWNHGFKYSGVRYVMVLAIENLFVLVMGWLHRSHRGEAGLKIGEEPSKLLEPGAFLEE